MESVIRIYIMGETLLEVEDPSQADLSAPCVYLTNSVGARQALASAGINYDGEINVNEVAFCKVEIQQECLYGSLNVPKMVDIMGGKYKIMFFVNKKNIVIVDDDEYSGRLIRRIQLRSRHQADSKERFIYNFISTIIGRDQIFLSTYERKLMDMSERVTDDDVQGLQSEIVPMRNELLTLQEYYDEVRDMGKELEENENHFFDVSHLHYFGTIYDRADRLMNKTRLLLEYAREIQDDYQTNITARQNNNMQFLTIISMIFMPLTLITSWYGMNFENMPELSGGYPVIIVASIVIVLATIFFFKKNKLL